MAKIYSTPSHIQPPAFDFRDFNKSKEDEKRFLEEVKSFCLKNSKSKDPIIGKVIYIPHADGKAMYMVLNVKPLELIHLNIGDAWDSPYADLLNLKRVREMIDSDEKIAKLFARKS